jgi:hypothetical protein
MALNGHEIPPLVEPVNGNGAKQPLVTIDDVIAVTAGGLPTIAKRDGKLPSERIAEILDDGRAMCALTAMKVDEADMKIHAIKLYLDERLGRS